MFHLDFGRASGEVTDDDIQSLRAQFARFGGLQVCGVLAPAVLDYAAQRCGPATFLPRDLGPLGTQLRCTDVTAEVALTLALNRPPLLRLLEQVTDQTPIRSIVGHIARLEPNSGQRLAWHDDGNRADRQLGLSIHLGREAYSGGVFQLRSKHDRRVLWDVANIGAGDLIAFSVAPTYEHRVTPVTGTVARTVFAGWAMASPLRPLEPAASGG